MNATGSSLNWRRILIAGFGGYLISFALVFCLITVYASALAVQSQGQPDPDAITTFADQVAPWASNVLLLVVAFIAGWWVARPEPAAAATMPALIVGGLIGLLNVVIGLLLGGFDLLDLVMILLTVGIAWVGARLSHR
jgi:hypothetical protein